MSDNNDPTITNHPSFGLISVNRITGHATLFGSPIEHQSYIRISIQRAYQKRSLSEDKYYATNPIIEVDLSESQFARMITSPNQGDGEPCTLRRISENGKLVGIPSPPPDDLSRNFHEDVKKDVAEAAQNIKNLYDKVSAIFKSKATIGKNDRSDILQDIQLCLQQVESNMPFVLSQFQEHIENQVDNAKNEIDAFLKNRAMQLGMQALGEKSVFPAKEPAKLPEPEPTK